MEPDAKEQTPSAQRPTPKLRIASEVAVAVHQTAELHEGAHDRNVDFYRPSAAEHTRKHRDALLGEGVRSIAAAAM
jgi:hypothetical protein